MCCIYVIAIAICIGYSSSSYSMNSPQHSSPYHSPVTRLREPKNIAAHLTLAAALAGEQDVQAALEEGANIDGTVVVNNQEVHNNNPLICALRSHHIETVRLLLEQKADVNIVDNGETALHIAVLSEATAQFIPALIKKGADINRLDREGRTPLDRAVFHRVLVAIKLLLLYKATGTPATITEAQHHVSLARNKSPQGN